MAFVDLKRFSRLPIVAMLVALPWLRAATATGAGEIPDQQPTATPLGTRSCVLAGSETQFLYELTHVEEARVHVDWTMLVERQLIGRGVIVADVVNAKTIRSIAIPLTVPQVRRGVVLAATLRMTLTVGAKKITVDRPLFVFHPDPFSGKKSLLTQADIHLLDDSGETSKVFDESSISFHRLTNIASIDGLMAGTLIVGEKTDFDEQRGLANALFEAASRGVSVLVLAPATKSAVIVSADVLTSERLRRVALRRRDVLQDFDKRFDTSDWLNGQNVESTMVLQAIHSDAVIGVVEHSNGWPWLELNVAGPKSAGKQINFIVCGFGVIRHWRSTPVPRYLLAEVLQKFVEPNSGSSKERD